MSDDTKAKLDALSAAKDAFVKAIEDVVDVLTAEEAKVPTLADVKALLDRVPA
jgi:hypothetical protein